MKTILSFFLCFAALMGCTPAPASGMEIYTFSIGKADSLLLRSGETAYLIDTGRGRNWDTVEEGLAALEIRRLDGVIITHMDSDHVGGLKTLLK